MLTPASKVRAWVLDVLLDEGYIRGYEKTTDTLGHPMLEISLKYYDGLPVIRDVKRVSSLVGEFILVSRIFPKLGKVWVCRLYLRLKE